MFIAFLYIWKIRTKPKPAGWLFSIYLIIAGFERFFVEFVRSTTESPVPGLSVAQVMALGLIVVGAVKLYTLRDSPEPEPAPRAQGKSGKKRKA
jgi:prolipoprotein diacylglyceryltransferase